jgi:hypothetical protein
MMKSTPMRLRRSRLVAVALVTLCVQLASAMVGATGLCCPAAASGTEHPTAAGCVMHATAGAAADAPRGHEHHAGTHRPTGGSPAAAAETSSDDGTRMTCDCARAGHLAISAPGLLPASPALAADPTVVGLVEERGRRLDGRLPSPTSPPPRAHAA